MLGEMKVAVVRCQGMEIVNGRGWEDGGGKVMLRCWGMKLKARVGGDVTVPS